MAVHASHFTGRQNELAIIDRELEVALDGQLRVVCYQYGGDSQSGLEPMGSTANWRCVMLEKLSQVKLLDDVWRTTPNHSRPGSCVIKVDIDVEDYPEPDPQNGQ